MAITLDDTVGGADSNTYALLATAETYFEGRPSEAWDAAEDADKDIALAAATSRLDQEVYAGEKASQDQRLKWPRLYLCNEDGYDLSSTAYPRELVEATCELAAAILTDPATLDASGLGAYKSLTVGPLSLQPVGATQAALPPSIGRLLRLWRVGGNRVVRG
jgi:hypothetical protein